MSSWTNPTTITQRNNQTNKPMSSSYIKGPELHSPSHRRIRRWWLEAHGLPVGGIYVLIIKTRNLHKHYFTTYLVCYIYLKNLFNPHFENLAACMFTLLSNMSNNFRQNFPLSWNTKYATDKCSKLSFWDILRLYRPLMLHLTSNRFELPSSSL